MFIKRLKKVGGTGRWDATNDPIVRDYLLKVEIDSEEEETEDKHRQRKEVKRISYVKIDQFQQFGGGDSSNIKSHSGERQSENKNRSSIDDSE